MTIRAPARGAPTRNFLAMIFNPDIDHRRSIRLQGYDYSQSGAYFITLCTKDRSCYFDQFEQLRSIVELQWQNIPERFPDVEVDEYVIMPNHVHGIIVIGRDAPCGYPEQDVTGFLQQGRKLPKGAHTLGDIVGAFKSLCANAWLRTIKTDNLDAIGKFWQSNYYEHIIRNEEEMDRIRQYISDNPLKWEQDWENPMVSKDQQRQAEQWMR